MVIVFFWSDFWTKLFLGCKNCWRPWHENNFFQGKNHGYSGKLCEEQIKLAWLILVISAMVIVFFGPIFVQKSFRGGETVERRGMEIISFN